MCPRYVGHAGSGSFQREGNKSHCNLILQLKGKETDSWKLKRDTSTVLPVIQAFKREESGSLFEQVC